MFKGDLFEVLVCSQRVAEEICVSFSKDTSAVIVIACGSFSKSRCATERRVEPNGHSVNYKAEYGRGCY